MKTSIYSLISALLLLQCEWPYSPSPEPYPDNQSQSVTVSTMTIYPVNLTRQICNPSISQDDRLFPGCMLWLGFSGFLNVNVLAQDTPFYHVSGVMQHDRLTIIDTTNTVRWYIKRDALGIAGHIQDPEWSTHPDYIACLGAESEDAEAWDGYAVRISDKKFLKFCEDALSIESTPHIWVPDSISGNGVVAAPEYNPVTGFVTKENIEQFFGTSQVVIVYTVEKTGLTLHYIDYRDSIPLPQALVKPFDKMNWDCESPLISPEGNWIAFNCKTGDHTFFAYIQRLKRNTAPVPVAQNAVDPHWWIDRTGSSDSYSIIYARINGEYTSGEDFTDPLISASGSAGLSIKQMLTGSSDDVPAHMGLQVDPASAAQVIATIPCKGGMSRNGQFLCTGYLYGYIVRLK